LPTEILYFTYITVFKSTLKVGKIIKYREITDISLVSDMISIYQTKPISKAPTRYTIPIIAVC